METSALIPLSAVVSYPPSHVGQQAVMLAQLKSAGVPVAETAVIPSDILARLTTETKLAEKLTAALPHIPLHNPRQVHQALMAQMQKLELPRWFTQPIQQWYYQHPGFVSVSIGTTGYERDAHHHIKGEANLVDSIISLWAQQGQLDTRTKEFKVFARPILIQREAQPIASGVATHDGHADAKSTITIHSVWGVYQSTHPDIKPDEFVVDVRTHHIVSRRLAPQYVQLIRDLDSLKEKNVLHYQQSQPSLTDEQVEELGEILSRVARSVYQQHTVTWSLADDHFYIAGVESAPTVPQTTHQPLITGQVVEPGIVGGVVGTDILVIPEFSADTLRSLGQATAVVCDRGIASPHLLQQIKKQHLVTIINTHQATRVLRSGQRVIVDANTGRVFAAPPPMTQESVAATQPLTTATKLYISAGNPDKATEYVTPLVDGVGVLRSEYTFAQFGDHPLAVIRSRHKGQLKKALHETIHRYQTAGTSLPVIYRSLNFTSQELRGLSQSEAFEPVETNPYLGFRGALKLLQSQELFDFEVDMLREYLANHSEPVGLMVPFVRSAGELQLIHNHLKDRRLHEFPQYSFWVQLNTPENVLSIDQYLKVPVDGFSINVRSIHALLHGIDPDEPELYSLYPLDSVLFEKLLQPCIAAIIRSPHPMRGTKPHPEIMLHLEDNSTQLVDLAVRLGCTGVTVKPPFVPTAKDRIREVETMLVGHT